MYRAVPDRGNPAQNQQIDRTAAYQANVWDGGGQGEISNV
jgi:hypothetical protein